MSTKMLKKIIRLWLFAVAADAQTTFYKNAFQAVKSTTTVTLSPAPSSTPSLAELESIYDGTFRDVPPFQDSLCTGRVSGATVASITISSTTPVKVRSIFTIIEHSDKYANIQLTSYDINNVRIPSLSRSSTSNTENFHVYSKVAKQVASVVLSMTASSLKALCTPEILVSDAHILYDSTNTDHSLQVVSVGMSLDSSGNCKTTTESNQGTSIPIVSDSTWRACPTTCGLIKQVGNCTQQWDYQISFAPAQGTDYTKLRFFTQYFIVSGQNFTNDIKVNACVSRLNSAALGSSYTGRTDPSCTQSGSPNSASRSQLLKMNRFESNYGLIGYKAKLSISEFEQQAHILRFQPLGYLYCMVSSISEDSSTTGTTTYLITPPNAQPAITKTFICPMIIDSDNYYTNSEAIDFCGYAKQATIIACSPSCGTYVSPAADLSTVGKATFSISTTDINMYGIKTFTVQVKDTRNTLETDGWQTKTFDINFKTCTLSVGTIPDQVYWVGDPEASFSISMTESNTCNFVPTYRTCTQGSQFPTWGVSVSTGTDCIVTWSTTDTTVESKLYPVPISITYAPTVALQTYTPSFNICLVQKTFTMTSPITYTVKGSAATQTLTFTSGCSLPAASYSVLEVSDARLTVNVVGSTLSVSTSDITLAAGPYTAVIQAQIGSVTVQKTLTINLLICPLPTFTVTTPVSYRVKASRDEQSLFIVDQYSCDYPFQFSKGTNWPEWGVELTDSTVSWYTVDLTITEGPYNADLVARIETNPPTDLTATLRINLSICQSTNTFPITSTVSYTVRDPEARINLEATDSCGYTISYIKGDIWPEWGVDLTGSEVSWYTDDLNLNGGTYQAKITAQFLQGTLILSSLDAILEIELSPCASTKSFDLDQPVVDYSVKSTGIVKTLTARDSCDYEIVYSMISSEITTGIILSQTSVSIEVNDLTLPAGQYSVVIQAEFKAKPSSSTLQQTLLINLAPCVSSEKTFSLSPRDVSYTVKDLTESQTLSAIDSCGYAVTYAVELTTPSFVWISGSQLKWQTDDITLEAKQYDFVVKATFDSNPVLSVPFELSDTLSVTLQYCAEQVSVDLTPEQSYIIGTSAATFTLPVTDTSNCGYTVPSCTLGSTAPYWVSIISGCTFSWQPIDVSLADTTYTVPVLINFAPSPPMVKVESSFEILLECTSLNVFTVNSPVSYQIKDDPLQIPLESSNQCDYTVNYSIENSDIDGTLVTDSILSLYSEDLDILEGDYQVQLKAAFTFRQTVKETLYQTLIVQVSPCQSDRSFVLSSPKVTYTVKYPSDSQTLTATDSCGYSINFQLGRVDLVGVQILDGTVLSWSSTDLTLLAQDYLVEVQAVFDQNPDQVTITQLLTIDLQACVPTFSFVKPQDQNYELGTPSQHQLISFYRTSGSDCGYQPFCSIESAPEWVTCSSSCTCSWKTSSHTLPTPSYHQVIVKLEYIDYANTLIQADTTNFQIQLTESLTECRTAIIIVASIDPIFLSLNNFVSVDLTPNDSASQKQKQKVFCGDYQVVWPSECPYWLKVSTNGFVITFEQIAYGSSSFDFVIQFSLKQYPTVIASQTITLHRQNCLVQSFTPTFKSAEIMYTIGSGVQYIAMPKYKATPDCTTHYIYSLSAKQSAGTPLDSFRSTQESFQIVIESESFAEQVLTFIVTASLSDEESTQNSDLVVTVKVVSALETPITNQLPTQDEAPKFSLPLLPPVAIPCLSLEIASQWQYVTPTIKAREPVIYEFQSPGLQSIFIVQFDGNKFTISLDTENARQPFPGDYPSLFKISYKNRRKVESQTKITFRIDCDAEFATAELTLKPKPKIAKVTGTGLVTIKWNTVVATNDGLDTKGRRLAQQDLSLLKNQTIEINGVTVPSIQIKVNPGDPDEDRRNLGFDYSFEEINARSLIVQLKLEKPEKISQSIYAQDKIEMTFNDPYQFQSTVSGMYIDQGYTVTANLPRQSLPDQLTVSIGSAVQVTKGVMLAAASMPFLLSAVLSQLLSVIRSMTIIVHMMTIQILLPANCVSFFAMLAPLVIFDLLPTDSLAEKIFQFPKLQDDDPLTVQFSSIGYNSQLIVQNMGSMFFIMIFYIVLVILLALLRRLTPAAITRTKAGQKVDQQVEKFVSNSTWSTPISFLYESYFILCVMSYIGTQSLVFGNVELWSQIFCSVLACVGAAFSVLFPFGIGIFYYRKVKHTPTPNPEKLDHYDRHQLYGTFDVEIVRKDKNFFTEDHYQEFLKRYGVLLRDYDLQRVGKIPAILTILFDFLRRLVLAVVICYLGRFPAFFIFTFNFTALFFMMFIIYYLPIREATEQARSIFNELTILAVNYHLICMSDFVFSNQAQSWVGNSLIALILLNCLVNVYISIHVPGQKGIVYLKRFYYRYVCKTKITKKPGKVQEENKNIDQATVGLKRRKVVPPVVDEQNDHATFRANDPETANMSISRQNPGLVQEDQQKLQKTATSNNNLFASANQDQSQFEQPIDDDGQGTEFRQPANSWRQLIKANESFFSNENLADIEEVPELGSSDRAQ